MLNFEYSIPTRIHFGEKAMDALPGEIKKSGNRILIVYGEGSIKKNGLYNRVSSLIANAGIFFQELPGVQPNPDIKSVRQGTQLCREHQLDFILAVGGGSTIDCSKAIAAGVYYEGDPWDFFIQKARVRKAVPLGTILTLAATGSEMNGGTVISNRETKEKLAAGGPQLKPQFSILDPRHTFSVSAQQTAAGTADIISHVFEQYFSPYQNVFLQNRMAEAILKTCFEYGPIAINEPQNYEARANLMWAGSLALNGLLTYGRGGGDWAVHTMEHELSALFDVTHGEGLAILTPHWMKHVLNQQNAVKFAEYSKNLFYFNDSDNIKAAEAAINKTSEFFKSLGIPKRLREVGVKEAYLEEMAEKAVRFGPIGKFRELKLEDVLEIYQQAF